MMRSDLLARRLAAALLPAVLLTAVPSLADTRLTGKVNNVSRVPNVPGARCGTHIEMVLTLADKSKRTVSIYDPAALQGNLERLVGSTVELRTPAKLSES